jgi:quinoprotein glucose dehydrogenase
MLRLRRAALAAALACAAWPSIAADADWSSYGGDPGFTRHSTAAQITPANVGRLKQAWVYSSGEVARRGEAAMHRSAFEATPILAAGKLAFCTQFNRVVALDPATGKEQWTFDPAEPVDTRPGNQYTCRGLAQWTDERASPGALCRTRLYMGTTSRRLVALDAASGALCPDFGDGGFVRLDPSVPLLWPGEMQITSPPVIMGDVLIVGSSISDNARAAAPDGAVRAFDARTGAPRWSFDPVPPSPGPDGETITGAGNVWAPISADPARGLVFLPTSSPSPDFYGGRRVGHDGLANAVVAVEAATGAVRWSFQTVHHDVWDYDLPTGPSLATLMRDGKPVDVVVQPTKTGFLFVLERDTGKPFFPVEERPVPQGAEGGEQLSPTQPFPSKPPPLVPQRITADDAWGFTFLDRWGCADRIASTRNEGLFTPPSLKGTILYPFNGGGVNWGGIAVDPGRRFAIVNTNRMIHTVTLIPRDRFDAAKAAEPKLEITPQRGTPYGMRREVLLSPLGVPCNAPPWGTLAAVDLNEGRIAWEVPLGGTTDRVPVGFNLVDGVPNLGGPIVTAGGLVFIGAAVDDYLRAFDLGTGQELWKGRLPAGGQATPMTYEVGGKQYVVIAAGGHARLGTTLGDSVVAFALAD